MKTHFARPSPPASDTTHLATVLLMLCACGQRRPRHSFPRRPRSTSPLHLARRVRVEKLCFFLCVCVVCCRLRCFRCGFRVGPKVIGHVQTRHVRLRPTGAVNRESGRRFVRRPTGQFRFGVFEFKYEEFTELCTRTLVFSQIHHRPMRLSWLLSFVLLFLFKSCVKFVLTNVPISPLSTPQKPNSVPGLSDSSFASRVPELRFCTRFSHRDRDRGARRMWLSDFRAFAERQVNRALALCLCLAIRGATAFAPAAQRPKQKRQLSDGTAALPWRESWRWRRR